MDILTIDFETYYAKDYSLSKLTTEEYIRDPKFEVIGVVIKDNDDVFYKCVGSWQEINDFLHGFDWGNAVAVAHNAMFDMAILNWHFGIRPKRIVDTLAMARALVGSTTSVSLASLAKYFSIGVKGTEVVHALGKRLQDFTGAELAKYMDYCRNDVQLTYTLFRVLADGFPLNELRLIDLTVRMFTEPALELDVNVLVSHLNDVQYHKSLLMLDVAVQRADLMSNPKLADTLRNYGVEPPMKISPITGKETYAFGKSDEAFKALLEHENIGIQALIAARLGLRSTLEESRTERLIGVAARGKLPIPLRYYAAHTGRWGGDDKVNMQNLPRSSPLKKAILAPEGYVLIDSDSSQIEARTLAWLAGQEDLVEAFDKGEDVYKIMASVIYGKPEREITKEERFVGKTTILGCFGPNTRVLTHRGWKRIVRVTATDMVWDGDSWVTHQGLLPRGKKTVVTAYGLQATSDHEILTERGWVEWSEVARNPTLFQSALHRASLPSFGGKAGSNPVGGTPLSGVLAGTKAWWTGIISGEGTQLDAINARNKRARRRASITGGMKPFYQTMTTARGSSTGYTVACRAVTPPRAKRTPGMAGVVSTYMSRGALIKARSLRTLYLSPVGMFRLLALIGSIITEGTRRVIFVSLPTKLTSIINGLLPVCSLKTTTYDLAYAGPKNRYTVATDAGPIIVHNCGYGMGSAKFRMQLKTFGVDMTEEECERIISVYRKTYPAIPKLWRSAGKVLAVIADINPKEEDADIILGREGVLTVEGQAGIRLPNGLYLRYPNLRSVIEKKTGEDQFIYDTVRGRAVSFSRIYGGKMVENICQALARIVIGEQMLAVAKKYRVVMTVHDSVVALVPEHEADAVQADIEALMKVRPSWALELPLSCEAGSGKSYGDC